MAEARRHGAARTLRLRIASGGGRRLDVVADTANHHVTATVDGLAVDPEPPWGPQVGHWDWGFVFEAVPPEGIDVTLTVHSRGQLPVRVLSYHDGLPPLPQIAPLPSDLTWAPHLSNTTVVAKGYRL